MVEVTLAEFLTPGSPSPLGVRAGIRQPDGSIAYQAGIQIGVSASGGTASPASGVTDDSGFFTGTATLTPGELELVVTVIADDPVSGAGAVVTATAHPIQSSSGQVVVLGGSWRMNADASAQAGNVEDFDTDGDEVDLLATASYSHSLSVSATASDATNSASASCNIMQSGFYENIEGEPFRFQVQGSASALSSASTGPDTDAAAGADATANSVIDFSVSETMTYGLTITGGDNARGARLTDTTNGFVSVIVQGPGTFTGTLEAGRTYQVRFHTSAAASFNGGHEDSTNLLFLIF